MQQYMCIMNHIRIYFHDIVA